MTAPSVFLNRLEFQRYLTYLESIAPRLTVNVRDRYVRPWYRRWLDLLVRGFLVWYTMVVAGLCVVLGMRGCS